MSLSIGIVGLPNVGKSTLFNTLTNNNIEASNYPFCTIEPNVGIVKVPDERLEKLSEVSKSVKIVPTVMEFNDIAGLVAGAHKGEGLGNQFLAHIRECDAICEVVRDFENTDIIHVDGNVDPDRDKDTISLELVYADLASVTKQLDRVTRDARGGDKEMLKKKSLLEKLKSHLDEAKPARSLDFNEDELELVKSFNLLTIKPIIYIINTDKTQAEVEKNWDGETVAMNIKIESEIAGLPAEDQAEFVRELGLNESGLNKFIKASYKLLDLITFITSGVQETRAWTVRRGALAPEAAGVIHSDFEKGFIRAEIVNWKDLCESGGEAKARERGLLRTEGKDYQMKDGDVCHFLHN